MPTDNVLPIDADAARILAKRQVRFRWFVAVLATLWLGALLPVLLLTPLPPLVPFAVLAVLVVLAEHRFVLFGDETSMSASIIVIVASVFVFADSAPLAGPMLVASLGGLYLPHLRHCQFGLMTANMASFTLATLAASLTNTLFLVNAASVRSFVPTFLTAFICSIVYWGVNSVIIGIAAALRNFTQPTTAVCAQTTSDLSVLALTIGSSLLVQHLGHTKPLELSFAIAIPLAAFEARLLTRGNVNALPTAMGSRVSIVLALSCTVAAENASDPVAALAFAAIGLFIVHALWLSTRWSPRTLIATAFGTDLVVLPPATCKLPLGLTFVSAVAFASLSLTYLEAAGRSRMGSGSLDLSTLLGLAVPTTRQLMLVGVLAIGLSIISVTGIVGMYFWWVVILALALKRVPLTKRLRYRRPNSLQRATLRRTAPAVSR